MQTTAKIALFAAVACASINTVENGLSEEAFTTTEAGGRRLRAARSTPNPERAAELLVRIREMRRTRAAGMTHQEQDKLMRDFFKAKMGVTLKKPTPRPTKSLGQRKYNKRRGRGRTTRRDCDQKKKRDDPTNKPKANVVTKSLEDGGNVKTITINKGRFNMVTEITTHSNGKRTIRRRMERVKMTEPPTTTKPTTTCTKPKSVEQCGQCQSNEQCKSGKCNPFTKKCLPCKWWQRKACRSPVAGCRGDKCRNKDYPSNWGAPTCPEKQSDDTIPEETDNTEDEVVDTPMDEVTEDDIEDEIEDEIIEDEISDEIEDEIIQDEISDEIEEESADDGIVDADETELDESQPPAEEDVSEEEENKDDKNSNQLMMGEEERAAFIEHNRIRTNPKEIIPIVKDQIKRFDSTGQFMSLEDNVRLRTNEGIGAWTEAVEVLQKQGTFEEFKWNDYLALAAQDHCNEQGGLGTTGHDSKNGDKFTDRVNKYGVWGGGAGENLAYSSSKGDEMIVQLYIDDGVPDRGHRVNMLSPDFELVGMAHCDHRKFGNMLAVAYATTFKPNDLGLSEAVARRKDNI